MNSKKKTSKRCVTAKVNDMITVVVPLSAGVTSLTPERITEIRMAWTEVRHLRAEYNRTLVALDGARQRYEIAAHGISPVLRSAIVQERE